MEACLHGLTWGDGMIVREYTTIISATAPNERYESAAVKSFPLYTCDNIVYEVAPEPQLHNKHIP